MKPINIAITGKKGSGKNTVARYIIDTFGHRLQANDNYDVYEMEEALADPIKQALNIIFLWDWTNWEHDKKEVIDPRWGISPRQAAQHFGTEWAQHALPEAYPEFDRTTGKALWINNLTRRTENLEHAIVVPDMRFDLEKQMLTAMGYKTIKVLRSTKSAQDILYDKEPDLHLSETELETITTNYTINNSGTLEELYLRVDATMEDLLGDEK